VPQASQAPCAPMSVSPTTLNNNGAAITTCVATSALSVGLSINTSTCVISGTPTGTLPATEYSIIATNSAGSSSAASVTLSVAALVCPTNYSLVSANPNLGVHSAFCVARFEMKCEGANCATACTGTCDVTDQRAAVSKPETSPWVMITQARARQACEALNARNNVINKYYLISNPEWMTIAHEIENTDVNWSPVAPATTGVVGVGFLNRGHSDNSPNIACDGALENVQTDCTTAGTGHQQKRTHTLSNGQVIWDFAGNVWDWVDWNVTPTNKAYSSADGSPQTAWREWTQIDRNISNGDAMETITWQASNPSLNRSNGIGGYLAGNHNIRGAAKRGGFYFSGWAGAFALDLDNSPVGTADAFLGFRCLFRP
jgi:hypothetical protein